MIKIFRKIRQNLLSKRKSGEYLKYAFGEILLVVIGILIALQINNLNEERKNNVLSNTHLVNIKKDLIADTTTFAAGINRIENTLVKQELLFNPDNVNNLKIDSLFTSLNQSFHSSRIYKINNSTFLKLTNSGFTESQSYKEIFIDINEYYTREFTTWFEYLEWDKENGINVFSPEALSEWYDDVDMVNLDNIEKPELHVGIIAESQKIFKEFLTSPRFRNYAWSNHYKMKVLLERMKYQKDTASDLMEQINMILNE